MAQARILCGVAGSGKTHRVLHEAAQAVLESIDVAMPDGGITGEPLYIIVPEQHTLLVERQLLGILRDTYGRRAYTGLQVTSFTRLGRMLQGLVNEPPRQLSELGRQLIAWQLLDGRERQSARANELSQMLAELTQYGVEPVSDNALTRCAQLLGERDGMHMLTELGQEGKLPGRLAKLEKQYLTYSAWCERLGLQVRDWAIEITEEALRRAEAGSQATANSLLRFGRARVWFDGFMGLTPPELLAAQAIISVCKSTTLTLLLDPALTQLEPTEQGLHPQSEWYVPTLELLTDWMRISRDAGAGTEVVCIDEMPPRFKHHRLMDIATGIQSKHEATSNSDIRAFTCPTVRAELDLTCHTILELVQERGWRFGDICVLARDVKPIQALLGARFADYGIPVHLDKREGLSRHPLVEYIKCALRLVAGIAQPSDVSVLLNTGLLPGTDQEERDGVGARELLRRTEWLVYQRRFRADKWLKSDAWETEAAKHAADGHEQDTALWQAAHVARISAFSQLAELARALSLAAREKTSLQDVLKLLWQYLLDVGEQKRLAESDWPILEQVSQLWDEFALLAQDVYLGNNSNSNSNDADCVTWVQFQQWLEFGLDQLSLRQPPLAVDHVIVSGVEEGRVPPVKAVLIIGMAEDSWQPHMGGRRLFTDAERAAVNEAWRSLDGRGGDLLAPGDCAVAAREPYLALVAATRAAEFVQFSYTVLDRERNPRRPSRYFRWLTQAFGVTAMEYAGVNVDDAQAALAAVHSVKDAALLVAAATSVIAPEQVLELLPDSARELIKWRQIVPANEVITQPEYWREQLLRWHEHGGSLPRLVTNATQLEAFAKCPFMFFSTHVLGLNVPEPADVGNRQLGILYHNVLHRLLAPLASEVRSALSSGNALPTLDWSGVAERLPGLIDGAIAELKLDETVHRGAFLKQRCEVLLAYMLNECARQATEGRPRWPLRLEAAFGTGQGVPAAVLADGKYAVELRGKIDRIDLDSENRLAVVDYKLGKRTLDAWRIRDGLELQLPVYLLALRSPTAILEDDAPRIWPLAQSEYQPIEPYFKGREATLDSAHLPTAAMVKAAVTAETPFDATEGLLRNTAVVIADYASRIKELQFGARPVRSPDRTWRACQHCAFQPLCRFDPLDGGRYRQVAYQKMDTTAWQEWLAQGLTENDTRGPEGGGEA